MSDAAPGPAGKPALTRVLGLAAGTDLLAGVVLAVIGVTGDVLALQLAGAVLLVSGAAMLAWVTWQRNRPTTP